MAVFLHLRNLFEEFGKIPIFLECIGAKVFEIDLNARAYLNNDLLFVKEIDEKEKWLFRSGLN